MESTTSHRAELAPPAGAYSHTRLIGPFFQISGRVPADLNADIEGQTVQALEQIQVLLTGERLGWQDVLMMRLYIADDSYWDGMDAAYRRVVAEPFPPRTTVSAGLAPGMLIEIDALAVTR
jgi:2-iminobutanoate/2-iminopropanoate deaminase